MFFLKDQYSLTTSGSLFLGTRCPLFNEILADLRSHSAFLARKAHGNILSLFYVIVILVNSYIIFFFKYTYYFYIRYL